MRLTQHRKMFHNGQLERNDILMMHPVLGRAPDKGILVPTGRSISLNRMTSGPDKIKQFGELNDQVIVVHPVKRVRFEELFVECRFQ